MKNLKITLLSVAFALIFLPARGQDKQDDKLKASTEVLTTFGEMKEKIPARLFAITEGIVIIPKLINAGLGVGGKRGKGVAMVKQEDGSWSDPVFVSLTGGSVGFQAGVQSVDLVLIVKSRETLTNIKKNSFNLGGDVSVTAGPLGRNSTASTDGKFDAEIYSYSKTKGLFAGISLSGSVLDIDDKANRSFYGEQMDSAALFNADTRDVSADRSESRTSAGAVTSLKQVLTDLFR